jgi:putative oxidoreductase
MPTFMKPFEPQAYALMRIVAGLLFIWHGTQKLLGFPGTPPPVPGFVSLIAGPIELIGGLLVMIGLFAGWAAFLCSGLMAAAYWMVHGFQALFPIANGGELAVLYCFVFLYIAAKGSGIWSVDAARGETAGFSRTPSPMTR